MDKEKQKKQCNKKVIQNCNGLFKVFEFKNHLMSNVVNFRFDEP